MANKKITEIKELLNARKTIEVKKLLDEVGIELEKLQKFFDDTKSVVRNLGKSNMLSKSEILEVINEYERKN